MVSLQSPPCCTASGLPGIKRRNNISAHSKRKGKNFKVEGERDIVWEGKGRGEKGCELVESQMVKVLSARKSTKALVL